MIRSGLSRVVKPVAAVTWCLALTLFASAQSAPVKVLVQTEMGDIVIEVDAAKAPNTAANFLKYVDAGAYDAGQFHRTVTMSNQPTDKVKIEVIQASVGEAGKAKAMPPIALERTSVTGLQHKDGTVSMARGAADSATSSWFVCINDQASLDFGGQRNPDGQGFAAFGRVIKGMDIVRKIHQAPNTDAQRLTPPIKIVKVSIVAAR